MDTTKDINNDQTLKLRDRLTYSLLVNHAHKIMPECVDGPMFTLLFVILFYNFFIVWTFREAYLTFQFGIKTFKFS